MLQMRNLEECFKEAKSGKVKFIGVLIEMRGAEKPELIINRKENFDNKLMYYKNVYNEDLTLKVFDGIKIIGFKFANSLEELEGEFFGFI